MHRPSVLSFVIFSVVHIFNRPASWHFAKAHLVCILLKAKNINKAAAIIILALSKTLGCRIEDLLEN